MISSIFLVLLACSAVRPQRSKVTANSVTSRTYHVKFPTGDVDFAVSKGDCRCKSDMFICKGRDFDLKTPIPKSKCRTTKALVVTNCRLRNVTRAIFKNMEPNITSLTLAQNEIEFITPDAFTQFRKLATLSFPSNNLTSNTLPVLFTKFSLLKSLKSIDIEDNPIHVIHNGTFGNLEHNRNLKNLNLSNIQINYLNCRFFSPLKHLNVLDLSKNNIKKLPMFCPDTSVDNFDKHPHLYKTEASEVAQKNESCLCNLVELYLSSNPLVEIKTETFSRLHKLKYLYLADIKTLSSLPVLWVPNLHSLFLSNTNVTFEPTELNEKLFLNISSLLSLDMSGVPLASWNGENLRQLLMPLSNLSHLNLTDTNITQLPEKLPSTLKSAILSRNKIKQWRYQTFENMTFLRKLLLNKNLIQTVNKTVFDRTMKYSKRKINLDDNPFHCDCSIVWFVIWCQRNYDRVINYKYYSCMTPYHLRGETMHDFKNKLLKTDCQAFNSYVVVAITLCILMVLSMVFAVIAKYFISKYRERKHYARIPDNS